MGVTSNWSLDISAFFDPSDDDHDALMKINRDKATLLSPVIIYICILLVVGIVGNPLAFYIYGWKWQDTATRIFLLYLAEIDFINCIVTMPTEIYVMLNFYYFRSASLCSMSRFFTYTYNNSTTIIFLVIAFDRYFRICYPHRQALTTAGSKSACFVSLCVAIAVSWPALFLYGNKFVSLQQKDKFNNTIIGVICDVKNNMDKTSYPLIYFIYLWCGFTSSFSVLAVLYVCIARVILRRKRKKTLQMTKMPDFKKKTEAPAETVAVKESSEPFQIDQKVDETQLDQNKLQKTDIQQNTNKNEEDDKESNPKELKWASSSYASGVAATASKRQGMLRGPGSTLMIFALTVVFLVTFLPFLIIMTVRQYTGPSFYPSLSPFQQVIVNLFSRSYLVNSCANPVVYGLCNSQFRKEVKELFKKDRTIRASSISRMETWQSHTAFSC